jgi:uncharacterized membrane protein YccC
MSDIDAIRARHVLYAANFNIAHTDDDPHWCAGCASPWPCDAIREADRADEISEHFHRMLQERDKAEAALAGCRQLNYELSNLALARERQRYAAHEDAKRLAEALGAVCDSPYIDSFSDESDALFRAARVALAAHDALKGTP